MVYYLEKLVFRSRHELPYPLNYMADEYPVLAALAVKAMIDWPKSHKKEGS